MAIYCTHDGTPHPDEANYCMACGRPLHAGLAATAHRAPAWEYADLVVALDLPSERAPGEFPEDIIEAYDQLVLDALNARGREGWQADETTEWLPAFQAGRVAYRDVPGFLQLTHAAHYESVTIRLKRQLEQ